MFSSRHFRRKYRNTVQQEKVCEGGKKQKIFLNVPHVASSSFLHNSLSPSFFLAKRDWPRMTRKWSLAEVTLGHRLGRRSLTGGSSQRMRMPNGWRSYFRWQKLVLCVVLFPPKILAEKWVRNVLCLYHDTCMYVCSVSFFFFFFRYF